jgi:hypothetical protein
MYINRVVIIVVNSLKIKHYRSNLDIVCDVFQSNVLNENFRNFYNGYFNILVFILVNFSKIIYMEYNLILIIKILI